LVCLEVLDPTVRTVKLATLAPLVPLEMLANLDLKENKESQEGPEVQDPWVPLVKGDQPDKREDPASLDPLESQEVVVTLAPEEAQDNLEREDLQDVPDLVE